MQKLIFEDYPSTNTPIDADNLNLMQDNVEEAINEIVEEGTNTDGTYIKYSNGKMFCYGYVQIGVRNYPQEFIENPLTIITPVDSNTNYMHIVQATTTTSAITIRGFFANVNDSIWAADNSGYVNYLAIGKWK